MRTGFRPPPLATFYVGADADHAAALIEAREQGFADGHARGLLDGHAAGVADGMAEVRSTLQPELDALQELCAKHEKYRAVARALRDVLAARDADLAALENTVRDVATAALRTLFPVLLTRAAGAEIADLLTGAMTERATGSLSLRAHPDTLATVAEDIATVAGSGRMIQAPDPDMPFGGAEIAWTGGGLTFDPHALLARVTAALARPPRGASTPNTETNHE